MGIYFLIGWILAICAFTLPASHYAAKNKKADFLIGLYCVFVLIAQILAAKTAIFNLGFKSFVGPAGVIVFSVTFLITDIVNEKFGRKETHKMIFIAFITQIAMSIFFYFGIKLPAAPSWNLQSAWEIIFGQIPRITLASWTAFLISENLDAIIFAWFKKLTNGRHLWMRNVFSALPSLLIDSLVFIPMAFWGIIPLMPAIIGQTATKWLSGIICIPFMYLNRSILNKKEKNA